MKSREEGNKGERREEVRIKEGKERGRRRKRKEGVKWGKI